MRGFDREEFEDRTTRAQALMADRGLAALLLSTEPEIRYFTGFLTRFWESPTRPWYLVVPAVGQPIAVIPSIGAALMGQTWIEDIRTWTSPDLEDDGVSLLAATLAEVVPSGEQIGVPDGHETRLRMPLADFQRVTDLVAPRQIASDARLIQQLRMTKSTAEVAKIRTACGIADRAFARVPDVARTGMPLSEVFRAFQQLCLAEGADYVGYLAGGAGPGGYADVISPANDAPLCPGDVLMLDTGLVWDGYFCDFDRNWSIGPADTNTRTAYETLVSATQIAFDAAKPGITAAQLHGVLQSALQTGSNDTNAGRLGHGLGMSLTEWPSLIAADHTLLTPGMVLTLEPSIATTAGLIVHEENIVITADGAEWLSTPASPEIPVI